MLHRSGRVTSSTRPLRRSGGSDSFYGAVVGHPRLIKRKSSAEGEAAVARRRSSKLSPTLQPPTRCYNDDDEASVAELGIKLFPKFPPHTAASVWVSFVKNTKACIGHYNSTQHASFTYKYDLDTDGFILVGEQDDIRYYHLNFVAQDKEKVHSSSSSVRSGCVSHPRRRMSAAAAPSRLLTPAALKFKFPTWVTASMDQEYCYACPSRAKHPK